MGEKIKKGLLRRNGNEAEEFTPERKKPEKTSEYSRWLPASWPMSGYGGAGRFSVNSSGWQILWNK
jgi:hypothetical protein